MFFVVQYTTNAHVTALEWLFFFPFVIDHSQNKTLKHTSVLNMLSENHQVTMGKRLFVLTSVNTFLLNLQSRSLIFGHKWMWNNYCH